MSAGVTQDPLAGWKVPISAEERVHHELLFYSQGPVDGAYLSGERARDVFLHSGLPLPVLSQIWNLADVSNDNVLTVEEFVLAMHLILKVKDGLSVPRALPKYLVPKVVPSVDVPDIAAHERECYQNVFNKLDMDNIDAIHGRELLLASGLSLEELSRVWDLSDLDRNSQLDREEWQVACHLTRALKQGQTLVGPVNVFKLVPERLSPDSYLARKHRVAEYDKKKNRLMLAKERRKTHIANETRRLELLKKRFSLHKELVEVSQTSEGPCIPAEEFQLYKAREEINIEKVEAIIYRLKKDHEAIRQETVKVILEEKGGLEEDERMLKLEQEDVHQRLATSHTKATKDPDPFHQLYELRRDLRKRSNLSEGEEPEIHWPFTSSPFNKDQLNTPLSGHTIFISPDPTVFNNNNSHKGRELLQDCDFGDRFIHKWSPTSHEVPGEAYDPIFMALNVPMDSRSWSGLRWSESDHSDRMQSLHQRLVDLKGDLEKLTEGSGGQLVFRNPEDYLARQKAQEEEERLEKSKYQRRYHGEKRSETNEKDVKRRSYAAPRNVDKDTKAREYREKRRSLNLDKKSSKSADLDLPTTQHRSNRQVNQEKNELIVQTDTSETFSPISASSPRSADSSKSPPKSPRSPTSPPRPSSKRKAAPPPPCPGSPNTSAELPLTPTKIPAPCITDESLSHSKKPAPHVTDQASSVKKPAPCVTDHAISAKKPAPHVTDQKRSHKKPAPIVADQSIPHKKPTQTVTDQPISSKKPTPNLTDQGIPPEKSTSATEPAPNVAEPAPNVTEQTLVPTETLTPSVKEQPSKINKSNEKEQPSKINKSSEKEQPSKIFETSVKEQQPKIPTPSDLEQPSKTPTPSENEQPSKISTSSKKKQPSKIPPASEKEQASKIPTASEKEQPSKIATAIEKEHPSKILTASEKEQPGRPPRRRRRESDENKSFVHRSFEKDQEPQSKEIAVNVNVTVTDAPSKKKDLNLESETKTLDVGLDEPKLHKAEVISIDIPKTDEFAFDSEVCVINGEKEESLLDSIVNALPDLQHNPKESVISEYEYSKTDSQSKVSHKPTNEFVDEIIVANVESSVECEINPVKLENIKGKFSHRDTKSIIEFEESVISEPPKGENSDSDSEDYKAVPSGITVENKESEVDDIDGYLDHVKPVSYKKSEDLQLAFQKIISFPQVDKSKDNRDNISITSDTSSTASEAPPLPDSAPPPFLTLEAPSLTKVPSLTDVSEEVNVTEELVQEQVETTESIPTESSSIMMTTEYPRSEVIAEVSTSESDEPISPRSPRGPERAMSPIADLNASLFSMRVKSPTREVTSPTPDVDWEVRTNGELHVDVGNRRSVLSDSDVSDGEQDHKDITGAFTPGDVQTNMVPTETNAADDADILLLSYNTKLHSPISDQSAIDSAFEDMLSSVTSNDPLSSTLDEFSHEEIIISEKTHKVESSPVKIPKVESSPPKTRATSETVPREARKFELALDKSSRTLSPGSQDFMAKAQQFADVVQKPPKVTVTLKRQVTSPDDLSDEQCLQMEAERRAVLSSSKMKRHDVERRVEMDEYEDNQAESYPYTDEDARREWQSDVSKRVDIDWEEKPDKVNLYSDNIELEDENTESVDRDSIANLRGTRKQWENLFNANVSAQVTPKRKQPTKVRHWDVKLPTPSTKVPENIVTVNHVSESDSESETEVEQIKMADVEYSNESAIEREIRLAMEREDMLRKEQEERVELKARQESSPIKTVDKSAFETTTEENNNRPTYHEMTEADRGSELTQREEQIQQEMELQVERESEIKQECHQDPDHSSSEEDENSNESIIEREIRLQQERELELTARMKAQATVQEPVSETGEPDQEMEEPVQDEVVVVETVEVEYMEPAQSSSSSTVSTPDNLSEPESPEETPAEIRTRISYEDAIASSNHQGESLIAKELREAREREDELAKQRLRVSGNFQNTHAEPPPPEAQSVPNKETEVVKPTYQKDVSPYKQTVRQAQDSLSSHSTEKSPASYIPPKQSVRVSAFGDKTATMSFNKTPDKKEKSNVKKPETPIEREIRLARERENEYRALQGKPLLPEVTRDNSDEDEEQVSTPPRIAYVRTPSSADSSLRGFSSSRLQKEIKQQSEREKKYQSEGKIISTSEQHVGLVKYMELTPQEPVAIPKRNFSITRKSVSEQPSVDKTHEQNGVPDTEPKTTPKTAAPETHKFARSASAGSGSLTFSYKESRHRAESKIEQELREMREREDELRSQREGAGLVTPRDPDSPRSPSGNSVTNKRSHFEQTV